MCTLPLSFFVLLRHRSSWEDTTAMSVDDITILLYNGSDVNSCHEGGVESMSRWEPNAMGRLEQAALDLYQERGFEQTMVTEIAERAGLTERTFFRYFADKREVLFGGQDILRQVSVSTIEAAPASATLLDVVAAALEALVPVIKERHKRVRQRQAVIAANPALQERELMKNALLTSAMAEALRRRGVIDPAASLAAEVGAIAFKAAFDRWASEPNAQDLLQLVRASLDQLKGIVAGT
jgi:AcrR family transcriptional regulator